MYPSLSAFLGVCISAWVRSDLPEEDLAPNVHPNLLMVPYEMKKVSENHAETPMGSAIDTLETSGLQVS